MALIKWHDSFSVNVAEIDQEHKRFVAMLNELDDAMNAGIEKDVLEHTLVSLVDYAATHFRTEERYFAQFGYPETVSHKSEHATFLRKCATFIEEFERGKATLPTDVVHFLSNWWQDHVMSVDKKYTRFFNERGLK